MQENITEFFEKLDDSEATELPKATIEQIQKTIQNEIYITNVKMIESQKNKINREIENANSGLRTISFGFFLTGIYNWFIFNKLSSKESGKAILIYKEEHKNNSIILPILISTGFMLFTSYLHCKKIKQFNKLDGIMEY